MALSVVTVTFVMMMLSMLSNRHIWQRIKNEILAVAPTHMLPTLLRISFHACVSHGIDLDDSRNAGLAPAAALLEEIRRMHPRVSIVDIQTFAGVVAVEAMGGPVVPWQPGRKDNSIGSHSMSCPMHKLSDLPEADLGSLEATAEGLRRTFTKFGLNDREIVALSGAHDVGKCHLENSGYDGWWTREPGTFSNSYFRRLAEVEYVIDSNHSRPQYKGVDDDLIMLPSDIALASDPEFRKYVVEYARDVDAFYRDFSDAFAKVLKMQT